MPFEKIVYNETLNCADGNITTPTKQINLQKLQFSSFRF